MSSIEVRKDAPRDSVTERLNRVEALRLAVGWRGSANFYNTEAETLKMAEEFYKFLTKPGKEKP